MPGLVTEAAMIEELIGRLQVLISELLELNGVGEELPIELVARLPAGELRAA